MSHDRMCDLALMVIDSNGVEGAGSAGSLESWNF